MRPYSASLLLFFALVAVYCIWILSLPLFPSQDGPVHLYYASILSHLLSGSRLFSEYFSIRHPVPPYSLHYVLMLLLMKVFSPILVEKCVVCLIIIGFCFGFRFLVTTISPKHASTVSLLSFPLSLNWAVGMGFHNYCLSLAFSFFAIAFWLRGVVERKNGYRLAFLVLCGLMLFTHPVPLFMTLAVVAGELLLRLVNARLAPRRAKAGLLDLVRSERTDLIFALLAFSSIAYIFLFVSGARTAEGFQHKLIQGHMLLDLLKLRPLILVWGNIAVRSYRIFLFLLLGFCFWVGVQGLRRHWRDRHFQSSDVLLIGSLLLGLLYPIIPRSINGSDYFADRLIIYIWSFAVIGAAAFVTFRDRHWRAIRFGSCFIAIALLAVYDKEVRAAAHHLERIEASPVSPHGGRGMFIDAPMPPADFFLTFDPYIWSSARYFRKTETVMLNAPWLDLPILPVAPMNGLFANIFPPKINNYPNTLWETLIKSSHARSLINRELDYIIFIGFSGKDHDAPDKLLKQNWWRTWKCERDNWYSVCYSPERQ
ncbi:MAG: hypothetical protein ACJ8LM_17765 [Candidatus Udaeobacter sp.]